MWIERDFGPLVERAAAQFPAVLVTGPRQVGKTSLLRRLFPTTTYVTFDDPVRVRQAEALPDAFLDEVGVPVILDEVQYVPSILRHLKRRIDADRRRAGQYLLTGSQGFGLMQGVSESLAGRCAILTMHSLGLNEALRRPPAASEQDYLARGGFPELYAEGRDPALWYSSYVATYLERDVRNLRQVGDLRDFDRFLRAVALRSAQLLSYSELARDVGVAPNTAKSWLSVLQASGQILLLEPYHRSLGKRLVKSPKMYLLDTGLLCHLVGVEDWASLMRSPLAGPVWETHVVGQVVRHCRTRARALPLWFWRTGRGDEVDLLVEKGARFLAIEAKLSENPRPADGRGIEALAGFYGRRAVAAGFVACRVAKAVPLGPHSDLLAVNVLELLDRLG